MTITVQYLSPAELDSAKAELLQRSGMTLDVLREKARVFALTPQELGILDQIEDLEYLNESA